MTVDLWIIYAHVRFDLKTFVRLVPLAFFVSVFLSNCMQTHLYSFPFSSSSLHLSSPSSFSLSSFLCFLSKKTWATYFIRWVLECCRPIPRWIPPLPFVFVILFCFLLSSGGGGGGMGYVDSTVLRRAESVNKKWMRILRTQSVSVSPCASGSYNSKVGWTKKWEPSRGNRQYVTWKVMIRIYIYNSEVQMKSL